MAQSPGEVEEGPVRTGDTSTAATAAAPTTEDIRVQIEQTRAEMSDTIDAIQTRLSPARAIADAKDSVRDATVGRLTRLAQRTPGSGRSLLETARDNPLAVIGSVAVTAGLTAYLHGRRVRAPPHENARLSSPISAIISVALTWPFGSCIVSDRRTRGLRVRRCSVDCQKSWKRTAPSFVHC